MTNETLMPNDINGEGVLAPDLTPVVEAPVVDPTSQVAERLGVAVTYLDVLAQPAPMLEAEDLRGPGSMITHLLIVNDR